MRFVLFILAAVIAFAQSDVKRTIIPPQNNSDTGILAFRELNGSGNHEVQVSAPSSLAATYRLRWPSALPGSASPFCVDTGGLMSFTGCGATSTRRRISDYFWTQTPGGSISVGLSTVTLTPCPVGLDASDTKLPVYLSGGTGTAEAAYLSISGGAGTCTSGAATGTIKFTAANTHTGAWTIKNAGFREAERASSAGDILLISNLDVYGTTTIQKSIAMECGGGGGIGCTITSHGDIIAIDVDLYEPVVMRDFNIVAAAPQVAAGAGIRIGYDSSSNHNCASVIDNVTIVYHYDGVHLKDGCKPTIFRSSIGGSTRHNVLMENLYCPDCGDQSLSKNTFGAAGAESISYTSGGGAKIIGNKFLGGTCGLDTQWNGGDSSILIVEGNSFDQQTECGVRVDGGDGLHSINISGNTFTPSTPSPYYYGVDYGNTGSLTLTNAQITGNTFHAPVTTDSTAIRIRTSALTSVGQNSISYFAIGIQVDAGAAQVGWGKNTILGTPTPFSIHASADLRPYSPGMFSGYLRPISSGSNIQAVAEFAEPASGSANNGILLSNTGTGTTSQRGLSWDNASNNLKFSRFDSARAAAETIDFEVEGGGNARAYNKLGIGISPGYQIDVGGGAGTNYARISDSTATTELFLYAENGAASIGTHTFHGVRFQSDSNNRWELTAAGMLVPWASLTYDIGEDSTPRRVRGYYGQFIDLATAAGTSSSDYISFRKANICNAAGGAGCWDMTASGSMAATSEIKIRDNAGSRWLEGWRALAGSPLNFTSVFSSLIPAKRAIADGDAVNDSVFPDNGSSSARWANYYGAAMDLSGAANITGNLSAAVINATGSPAYRVAGTTIVDASRNLSNIGTGGFSGLVTASAGLTVTGGNTTVEGIRFGTGSTHSVGATGARALRVFTDGITTSGPSYWESGSDFIMRSGSTMTLEFGTPGLNKVLTSDAAGVATWQAGGVCATCFVQSGNSFGATATIGTNDNQALHFETNGTDRWDISAVGHLIPDTNNTYNIGHTSFRPAAIYSVLGDFSGVLTLSGTVTGDVVPTSNATYGLGNGSFRWLGYMNTLNVNGAFTMVGTLTGDWIPTSNNTYVLGNGSFYWNQVRGETIYVENSGRIRPTTTNTGSVGLSTARFNKGWFTDLDITGTIIPPSGTVFSGTKTVRASGGLSDCTLVFSVGLLTTGGSC